MAVLALHPLVRGAVLLPLRRREAAMSNEADYIGEVLAAEEHRQGMAYGDDADHCGDCAAEVRRRRQAECEHADVHSVEVTTLGQPRRELLATCGHCGLSWREEGEWR